MRVVLLFPPLVDPTQPYASLPALTAFLRSRGWEVSQIDVSIEFTRYMLTGESLAQALGRVEKRLYQLDGRKALGDEEAWEYALLAKAALKAPLVIPEIEEAIKKIKEPDCFRELKVLNDTKRIIHEAMEILSAGWFPHRFSLSRPKSPAFDNLSQVLGWVRDRKGNPYADFYVTQLLPRLKKLIPGAIGISLTYPSQVIPAMILVALLKDKMPDVPVIFGGNMISTWYDTLENCPDLFDWCNFLIAFEGESSLDRLLSTFHHGGPLNCVPNLVYCSQGKVRKNPVILEELEHLPTPDYSGLPLDLYLAPEIVFSLYSSRGCYWSKCSFCAVSPAMRKGYRVRSPEKVHADVVTLCQKHQAKFITFVDDCIAPATLSDLATFLKERGPIIYWQGEVRFEPALTGRLLQRVREARCLNLIFGLESYAPRVLALMNKGTCREEIDRIIDDCRRLGMAFNLQFFFGFPGEKPEEAELTANFIKAQAHGAATFSFGTFELQRGSHVARNPGEFAITYVDQENGPLAVKFAYSQKPEHAERIKRSLQTALFQGNPYPYAGLSINAHTLIFLYEAGTSAMGDLYQKAKGTEPDDLRFRPEMMGWPLIPPKNQTVGTFAHVSSEPSRRKGGSRSEGRGILLYNHPLDKILQVSPLVLWLLKGLNGTATPAELVGTLRSETAMAGLTSATSDDLLPLMAKAVKHLYQRGFLIQSH